MVAPGHTDWDLVEGTRMEAVQGAQVDVVKGASAAVDTAGSTASLGSMAGIDPCCRTGCTCRAAVGPA